MIRSAAILPDGEVLRIVDARALVAELPPPPKILLVDDSGTQLERGRRLLAAAGYLVETAPDGVVALARLQEGGIDAVLTDFEMPGLDGFELVRAVRADDSLAATPIVVWSASGGDELYGMAREAGSDAFFMKGPEANEQVAETLLRLIGSRPAP